MVAPFAQSIQPRLFLGFHFHGSDSFWSFIWGPVDLSMGEAEQMNCTQARTKRHPGDALSNQCVMAGVPPRNVGPLN